MSGGHSDATAADQLREAVDGFTAFIEQLPRHALAEKVWGAREVLVHLVFWQESYVTQVQALLSGDDPMPPDGSYEALNRQAVADNRDVSVAILLQRLRKACDCLCSVVERHDPRQLVFMLKAGSVHRRPLTWYLQVEAEHIVHHQKRLAEQFEWDGEAAAERLQETVDAFCAFIRALPEEALAPQEWGPREVLAHLVTWHERYVAQIAAATGGDVYQPSWDRSNPLNAEALRANEEVSVPTLLHRLQAADDQLRHFARTLEPQAIAIPLRLRYTLHTLDEVIDRVEQHVDEHLQTLRSELA